METIATLQECEVALGISEEATVQERALISLAWPAAESRVKKHLGFNPVQESHVEFYPCDWQLGDSWDELADREIWDVNLAATHAVNFGDSGRMSERLVLRHIPVRSVTEIREDTAANFGQQGTDFPADSILVAGVDYWLDISRAGYCESGIIYRSGSWSSRPGTIRVSYTSGFAISELMGLSGVIDAAAIKQAVLLTLLMLFHQMAGMQKKSAGFTGPLKSERLGDYNYTLSDAGEKLIGGLSAGLPDAALELLEPWEHVGAWVTG